MAFHLMFYTPSGGPRDIIHDPDGNRFNRIWFDPDSRATMCACDSHGNVYVVFEFVDSTTLFDRFGQVLAELETGPGVVDVEIGYGDRIYVLHDSGVVSVFDRLVLDWDGDGLVYCDNCPDTSNANQSTSDADGEGDACDLDDGLIYTRFVERNRLDWQHEQGSDAWNLYRGDLAELRSGGDYTQLPGSNDLAHRECGLSETWVDDQPFLDLGQATFYLTTGVADGVESDLGTNSAGQTRPNANPCP
jgi:hypothetical protein